MDNYEERITELIHNYRGDIVDKQRYIVKKILAFKRREFLFF